MYLLSLIYFSYQVKTYCSDANETIYFSLRSHTFLDIRTIIGTAEIDRDELLKTPEVEIEGTQNPKSALGTTVDDFFVAVPLSVERSAPGDPQLSITISVKMTSLEQNAELLVQGAETVVATAGIESQRDLGLELEGRVSSLRETLKTVVDIVVDGIDFLAEVWPNIQGL